MRRPESDVDHDLQAGLLRQAHRLVELQPARLHVRARIAGVEAGGLALGVRVACEHGPARRQPHAIDAQRAQLLHRAAHLLGRPVQQRGVVLHERLERRLRRCARHEDRRREDERGEQATVDHRAQCGECRARTTTWRSHGVVRRLTGARRESGD